MPTIPMTRRIHNLWLAALVFLVNLSSLSSFGADVGTSPSFIPHNPIFIDGNVDFTAANGVTGGRGTVTEPYVIEGWEVNASGSTGLVIQNTDAHAVVRNAFVHSGGLSNAGFRFYNVQNVRLEGIRSVGNREGVHASGVDAGLAIVGSYFEGNGVGVLLWRTSAIRVRNNTFVQDGISFIGNAVTHFASHEIVGNRVNNRPLLYYKNCADVDIDGLDAGEVIVTSCSRVRISRLQISDTDVGIFLAFVNDLVLRGSTITNKARVSGMDEGLHATFVTNATFERNVIADEDYGMSFDGNNSFITLRNNTFSGNARGVFGWLSDFSIVENSFSHNWKGLELVAPAKGLVQRNAAWDNEYAYDVGWGHNITIARNAAWGNGKGVSLLLAANVTVLHNNLTSGRGYGVLASHSENLTVAGNAIRDNWYGVYLAGTRDSAVYRNNIVGNQVQGWDSMAMENAWDAGYPGGGNYWSSYGGEDRCSGRAPDVCPDPDGIGDVPFVVDDDTQDRFPRMDPIVFPGDDRPIIAHDAPDAVAPLETVTIQAYVVNARGVERVLLHYRSSDQEEYQALLMTRVGNHRYQVEITAPAQVGVIEYHFRAYDTGGNVTLSPETGDYRISVIQPSVLDLSPLVYLVPVSVGVAGVLALIVLRRRNRGRRVDSGKAHR